jgi:hypothetical protein
MLPGKSVLGIAFALHKCKWRRQYRSLSVAFDMWSAKLHAHQYYIRYKLKYCGSLCRANARPKTDFLAVWVSSSNVDEWSRKLNLHYSRELILVLVVQPSIEEPSSFPVRKYTICAYLYPIPENGIGDALAWFSEPRFPHQVRAKYLAKSTSRSFLEHSYQNAAKF